MRTRLIPLAPLLALLAGAAACTHNVAPKVTPQKIRVVRPPIASRAMLLLPASFEAYTSQSSSGFHNYNHRLGASAAAALTDLVRASFIQAEIRRIADAELLGALAAPPDSTTVDVLLVPAFESSGLRGRAFDRVAEVRLRLDARVLRTGETYSWASAGRAARVLSSVKGLTGSAMETALGSLADSLGANRERLEPAPGGP